MHHEIDTQTTKTFKISPRHFGRADNSKTPLHRDVSAWWLGWDMPLHNREKSGVFRFKDILKVLASIKRGKGNATWGIHPMRGINTSAAEASAANGMRPPGLFWPGKSALFGSGVPLGKDPILNVRCPSLI